MTLLQDQLVGKDPTLIRFNEITGEHHYRRCGFLLVLDYIVMIITTTLHFCFLASDIYTLIQIYALKNWDNYHAISYVPILVYRIVFTVCIGLYMIFLIFSLITGIHIYRKNFVISSYLHSVAREINSFKSYERFCIYQNICTKSLEDWIALSLYQSLHYDIYPWLFADTPRQLLNGATVAYTISNSFTSSNLAAIIRDIASTNEKEAILLSFMTFSFAVWIVFSVKHLILLISAMCVVPSVKRRTEMSFSKGCKFIVAESVMRMYEKEEKKHRKSMMRKRRFPSIIKDNSVAELTAPEDSTLSRGDSDEKNPFGEDDFYEQPSYPMQDIVPKSNSSENLGQSYGYSKSRPLPPQPPRALTQHSNNTELSFTSEYSVPLSNYNPIMGATSSLAGPRSGFNPAMSISSSVTSPVPAYNQSTSMSSSSIAEPQPQIRTNNARQRAHINNGIPTQQPQVARTTTDMTTETDPYSSRQHYHQRHQVHSQSQRGYQVPSGRRPEDQYFPSEDPYDPSESAMDPASNEEADLYGYRGLKGAYTSNF
ncbi:DEKNAAC100849 [Brettanomyces naardenensis]|uniref:DEKNAAC100849 n=1 Tax=Brettanomyces naardenensis TaxID=13370 RepID=A0A448YF02_BRENA|nr:DEKNAAC100849 [Brettanomyces naardenensis]